MSERKIIHSVRRALDILEFTGSRPKGVKLSTITTYLKFSKSAVYKTVTTLVAQGFLERYGSPSRFRLSAIVEGIRKRQVQRDRAFVLPAMPLVATAARALRCKVMISQMLGGIVASRLHAQDDKQEALHYWHSGRVAPYGTAVLFLAFMEPYERAIYRERNPWSAKDKEYWNSFPTMEAFLPLIRKTGRVAFVKGSMFRCAAAVLDPKDEMVAMVSASKPFGDLRDGEAKACLREMLRISRILSGQLVSLSGTPSSDKTEGVKASEWTDDLLVPTENTVRL